MNAFYKNISAVNETFTQRNALEIVQVSLGDMCNQRCVHCHINAGPRGDKIASREVIDAIIAFLGKQAGLMLDITGGCPELNPHFRYMLERAEGVSKNIIVRNNLTILTESGMEDLPALYKQKKITVICSLPCYTKDNVDQQRGEGVFEKSIDGLRRLNAVGYGLEEELELHVVYNPGGAFLPAVQVVLERDYKRVLYEEYGIVFNKLLTITNAPIKRFEQYLRASGKFDEYMQLLIDNFNRDVAGTVMCRNLISVGWNGIIYDCDFNQSLGLTMRDNNGKIIKIKDCVPQDVEYREIVFGNHCYCCTAGNGSSCSGALA